MQPRTVKGPSWVNEPQLGPKSPEKKAKGVVTKGDWLGANHTPSQDTLSDLEWMRQRMAKSTAEDSDANIRHSDSSPTHKADTHQVCRFLSASCRLTQLSKAQCLFK